MEISNREMQNEENLPVYTISTAAQLVGISEHALRMYEREGLIIPFKKSSGHRLYSKSDIDRLNCIRNMIVERKMSIAGMKGMLSLIPCWELRHCSESIRENCDGYQNSYVPCWTLKRQISGCKNSDCRTCFVYSKHGKCTEIKQVIKEITNLYTKN